MNKVNKLKYPTWFVVIFYLLTIGLPLTYIFIEGYKAPSQTFRITFTIVIGLCIFWLFLNKFMLKNKFTEIKSKKAQLEHEYQIQVGNTDNIKKLWYDNEVMYNIITALSIFIYGLTIIVIAYGISLGCLKVKAMTTCITSCYVVAYLLKFLVLTLILNNDTENGENDEQ